MDCTAIVQGFPSIAIYQYQPFFTCVTLAVLIFFTKEPFAVGYCYFLIHLYAPPNSHSYQVSICYELL